MLETSTGPANSSGATIATTSIYDLFGRVVGRKSTGDTDWTCITYDARGRVTTGSYPANGGVARTATSGGLYWQTPVMEGAGVAIASFDRSGDGGLLTLDAVSVGRATITSALTEVVGSEGSWGLRIRVV